jgi:hypothetical protein
MLLGLASLLALTIGACGGGSSSDSGESSEASTTANGGPGGFQLSDEQRSCIEDKGVTLPEPGNGQPPSGGTPSGGAPGGDFQELQQALEDCGVDVPNGPPGGANFDPSAIRKQIGQYVACVRKNGYDLPDPNTSGNGPVFDPSQVDQNDPKFKAASAECQDRLPQGGPAPGQ